MLEPARPLLLVGGGKMGEALLAGWLTRGVPPAAVLVVEPTAERRELLRAQYGVSTCADPGGLADGTRPAALLLSVKPQMMDAALPAYKPLLAPDTLVLSIAAGKPIALFERLLGQGLAVVRAMPNTPAAVGRGITVMCANTATGEAHKALARDLMEAVGEAHWVDEEELIHAVTAVSGSGPAYVFLMIEAMAAAARSAGLSEELAMRLARATIAGAGELAYRSPDSAAQLRRNVTSPGGTTAAALEVLMADDGLGPLVERAVAAAVLRSRELA